MKFSATRDHCSYFRVIAEEFCADLLDLDVEEQGEAFRDIINILDDIGVDEDTRTSIFRCLNRV